MTSRETYVELLAQARKETGIESLVADESGLVSVRVDDAYNVNLQLVEATGRVLCFVEVADLPKDAPKEVYRDLLAGGLFGKDTAGGHFSLEPETETVVYNYLFDFDTAAQDIDDFIETLEKILQLCDIWAERIKGNLADIGAEAADPSPLNNHMFVQAYGCARGALVGDAVPSVGMTVPGGDNVGH